MHSSLEYNFVTGVDELNVDMAADTAENRLLHRAAR
jgi:hypothetical protein